MAGKPLTDAQQRAKERAEAKGPPVPEETAEVAAAGNEASAETPAPDGEANAKEPTPIDSKKGKGKKDAKPEEAKPEEGERPEPTEAEWAQRREALLAKVPKPEDRPKSIYGMLAQILGIIGAVEKRGFNAFHKYRFVKETDLVEAVRPLLSAYGIFVHWSLTGHERRTQVIKDRDKNITGESESLTVVEAEYFFVHGESGQETKPQKMMGYGDDNGDKGLYKALTGMEKYFLMKTFLVSTGDDPEADRAMDERAANRQGAPRVNVQRGGQQQGQRQTGHGGRQAETSKPQAQVIGELLRSAGIRKTPDAAKLIGELLGVEVPLGEDANASLQEFIAGLEAGDGGKLIYRLRKHVEDQGKGKPEGGQEESTGGTDGRPDTEGAADAGGPSNPAAPAGPPPDETLEAGAAV